MIKQVNKEMFVLNLTDQLQKKYGTLVSNRVMGDVLKIFDDSLVNEKLNLVKESDWINKCLKEFNYTKEDVFSTSRKQEVVFLRHSFAYILTNTYGLKSENVASHLGLDRTTISANNKQVKNLLETKNQSFLYVYTVCYNLLFEQQCQTTN